MSIRIANLLHLSTNLWNDSLPEHAPPGTGPTYAAALRFDDRLYEEITLRMRDAGFTTVVLDLGDGVRYDSHPEISVDSAWSVDRLSTELDRLRGLGLEPLPKLNFSTSHDAWMGMMARRVSTPEYYAFCTDLINEVAALFDRPALFHIGMDEEILQHQTKYPHVVLRQYELWWHDLALLVEAVEATGSRAWMWADYAWDHPEFFDRISSDIVQSNWYYGADFEARADGRPRPLAYEEAFLTYRDLEDASLDQIPTGSNWDASDNFAGTVDYCRRHVSEQHLLGYLQTTWKRTEMEFRDRHLHAIDVVARVLGAGT